MPDGACHTNRGWIYGYQLHMVSSTDSSVMIHLTSDVTAANIPNNQVYPDLTSSLPSPLSFNLSLETIRNIHYIIADPGYDDQSLYELSAKLGFQLVCLYEDTGKHLKSA